MMKKLFTLLIYQIILYPISGLLMFTGKYTKITFLKLLEFYTTMRKNIDQKIYVGMQKAKSLMNTAVNVSLHGWKKIRKFKFHTTLRHIIITVFGIIIQGSVKLITGMVRFLKIILYLLTSVSKLIWLIFYILFDQIYRIICHPKKLIKLMDLGFILSFVYFSHYYGKYVDSNLDHVDNFAAIWALYNFRGPPNWETILNWYYMLFRVALMTHYSNGKIPINFALFSIVQGISVLYKVL
jgi:hypothetical protein